MTPRKSLSRVRKIAILDAHEWRCAGGCGHVWFQDEVVTKSGVERRPVSWTHNLEFDHFSQLALGGKDHADNIRPLCIPCHKKKTLTDAKVRAKIKRISGQTGTAKRERARKRKLERAKRRVKMLERQA